MTNAWASAREAIKAAETLCTVYMENEGSVPGELLRCHLAQMRGAPVAAVATFYYYLHKKCPRLMALFARAEL
jgi:hypothetical protein